MARVRNSFSMAVEPARAQAMFERDILPELHRDGEFKLYRDVPGFMGFSNGIVDVAKVFDPSEVVDPDDAAHKPQDDEPEVTAASSPRPRSMLVRGAGVLAPNVIAREPSLYVLLRRLTSRRIKVAFAEQGGGTLVTIRGSAERCVARGLNNLGKPGRWPAIADEPHD